MTVGCLFCRIVQREVAADIVCENEKVIAFTDVNPMAPIHILVVPKQHLASINDIDADSAHLVAEMALVAKDVAKKMNLEAGYRLVVNTGKEAGQSVFHLHMHVLGGRTFAWPPG